MLTHIHISNFAIIESLDLELTPGLTVITGETGAGKSIMIDAIGLVLGDRADATAVRSGQDRAEVTLAIDSRRPEVARWLAERELDTDGECLLRRSVSADGRSRGYINGTPVTLALLKELGELFINIHGQHDHQALLAPATQRSLLDSHADLGGEVERLRELHARWKSAERRYADVLKHGAERQARADLLHFQVGELEALALQPGELATLDDDLRRHAHGERLRAIAAQSATLLYEGEDQSAHRLLAGTLHLLREACEYDERFSEVKDLIDGAQIQIEEALGSLRRLERQLDTDPAELQRIESRLSSIHDLARKHRVQPDTLPERLATLRQELAELEGPEHDLAALDAQRKAAAAAYDAVAAEVRARRIAAAADLSERITALMQELGMQGGRFLAVVTPLAEGGRREYGTEDVEFLVSANPGQRPRALSKVASGGELSRISLAIQLVAAQTMRLPTMIFDEVDSGIGGAVADGVGRLLRRLGESCQVFCVTHLPQVAAYGHRHLRVSKTKTADSTTTALAELKTEGRVEEIARMLGGAQITRQTLQHAEEMLVLAGRHSPQLAMPLEP